MKNYYFIFVAFIFAISSPNLNGQISKSKTKYEENDLITIVFEEQQFYLTQRIPYRPYWSVQSIELPTKTAELSYSFTTAEGYDNLEALKLGIQMLQTLNGSILLSGLTSQIEVPKGIHPINILLMDDKNHKLYLDNEDYKTIVEGTSKNQTHGSKTILNPNLKNTS